MVVLRILRAVSLELSSTVPKARIGTTRSNRDSAFPTPLRHLPKKIWFERRLVT
jgi:hypothetical protein